MLQKIFKLGGKAILNLFYESFEREIYSFFTSVFLKYRILTFFLAEVLS